MQRRRGQFDFGMSFRQHQKWWWPTLPVRNATDSSAFWLPFWVLLTTALSYESPAATERTAGAGHNTASWWDVHLSFVIDQWLTGPQSAESFACSPQMAAQREHCAYLDYMRPDADTFTYLNCVRPVCCTVSVRCAFFSESAPAFGGLCTLRVVAIADRLVARGATR